MRTTRWRTLPVAVVEGDDQGRAGAPPGAACPGGGGLLTHLPDRVGQGLEERRQHRIVSGQAQRTHCGPPHIGIGVARRQPHQRRQGGGLLEPAEHADGLQGVPASTASTAASAGEKLRQGRSSRSVQHPGTGRSTGGIEGCHQQLAVFRGTDLGQAVGRGSTHASIVVLQASPAGHGQTRGSPDRPGRSAASARTSATESDRAATNQGVCASSSSSASSIRASGAPSGHRPDAGGFPPDRCRRQAGQGKRGMLSSDVRLRSVQSA